MPSSQPNQPSSSSIRRVAMWSGPRNISTAMMRSWGSRADAIVCDEPLYAHYLMQTGFDHPGAQEVIDGHEADWRRVAQWLAEDALPDGKVVFYQKHMAHHLLPTIEREWLDSLTHAFLLRDPRDMLTSLLKKLPSPGVADTGLPQQVELFERVHRDTGAVPPVVDARDVQNAPERVLPKLCEQLGVPFDAAMLSWATGPRETDGVWAKYWYESVYETTRFEPYRDKDEDVPPAFRDVLAECEELYARLAPHRITADD